METTELLDLLNKRYEKLSDACFYEALANGKVFGITETEAKKIKRKARKSGFAEAFAEFGDLDSDIDIMDRIDKAEDVDFGYKDAFYQDIRKMTPVQICFMIDRLQAVAKNTGARFFGNKHDTTDAYYEINRCVSGNFGVSGLAFKVFGSSQSMMFKYVWPEMVNVGRLADCLIRVCKRHFYLLHAISEDVLKLVPQEIHEHSFKEFKNKFSTVSRGLTNGMNKDVVYQELGDIVKHATDNIKKSAGRGGRNDEFAIRRQVDDLYVSPLDA